MQHRVKYISKLTDNFRKSYIENMFVGSGNFVDAAQDQFGVIKNSG